MDEAETQPQAEIECVDDDENNEPEPEAPASTEGLEVEALPPVDSPEVLSRRMQFGVVCKKRDPVQEGRQKKGAEEGRSEAKDAEAGFLDIRR